MNREYHKWYSPTLRRDMEILVFGHGGTPMIVFPTSMGRFFEYEDRGMISAIWDRYEHGQLQAFCVDGIDKESWYNRRAHPGYRAFRANEYDQYLVREVIPFIKHKNWASKLVATGCSFGGYHAANFGFRHPDLVTNIVSMSGSYTIRQFANGSNDQNVYFNCPREYMRNMNDPWFLDRIRRQRIVLTTSDWDICLGDNREMSSILWDKGIWNELDVWGQIEHDWPLWRHQAVKHLVP